MAFGRHGRDARRSPIDIGDTGDDEGPPVDLSPEVVDEITWYMREHKVSRADLACAMGVSPGRVSQILSGGESLTPRTLGTVLTALGAGLEITLHPAGEHAPA
jgi:hypothetical protein